MCTSETSMSDPSDLRVAIFTYERPTHLMNAVMSVVQNMPRQPISIYDDASSHSEAVETLRLLENYAEVHSRKQPLTSRSPRGGLYQNMQQAVASACDERANYLFLCQDDVQIVRPFSGRDMAALDGAFDRNPDAISIWPFFHGQDCSWRFDSTGSVYMRPDTSAAYGFQDVTVLNLRRFRDAGLEIRGNEHETSRAARDAGFRTVAQINPWAAFTPAPDVRRRGPTIHQLIRPLGRYLGLGFHPWRSMSAEDVALLHKRDPSICPSTLDWLSLIGSTPDRLTARAPSLREAVAGGVSRLGSILHLRTDRDSS